MNKQLKPLLTLGVLSMLLIPGLAACHRASTPHEAADADKPAEHATNAQNTKEEKEPGIPAASVALAIMTSPAQVRPLALEAGAVATIAALPDRQADLGFKSGGRIATLNVTEGDRVHKGQVLGTLAEADQTRFQLAIAQKNLGRDEELYSKGIIARRQVENTQLQAQDARLTAAGTQLISPFSGTVLKQSHGVGEVVDPSSPVLSVADLSTVYAVGNVYESDLQKFKVGQTVTLTTATYPGRRFSGRVALIADALDPVSKTFQVKVRVPNSDHALKIGMSGQVLIQKGTRQALAVPASCLLATAGGGKQVFVRDEDRYEPRPVKVGLVTGDWAEILDGVKAGEAVVTHGQFELQANMNGAAKAQGDDD